MLILSVCLYVQKVKEQVVLLGPLRTQHKFRNTRFTSLPGICWMKHCYQTCTDYWNMPILHVLPYVPKEKEQIALCDLLHLKNMDFLSTVRYHMRLCLGVKQRHAIKSINY